MSEDEAVARLLLVVKDAFAVGERGVIVVPDVDLGEAGARSFVVELRRPDGTVVTAQAEANVPMVHPPQLPPRRRHVVRVSGLTNEDLPVGTEIWIPPYALRR